MRSRHWRLDEVFVKINGKRHELCRAVDDEGEGPENDVNRSGGKKAALNFLRESLRRHGRAEGMVTDRPCLHRAASGDRGIRDRP